MLTTDTNRLIGCCLCGEIRYESDAPPYLVGHCYCQMCPKAVANQFGTGAFFKHAYFRHVKGTPAWFTSPGAKRGFCAQCGSSLAFQRPGYEDDYCAIWLDTLDRPEAYEATAEWHTESKISRVVMDYRLHDATPRDNSARYGTIKPSV